MLYRLYAKICSSTFIARIRVVVVGSFELSFDVNIREITFVKLKYYLVQFT